MHVNYKPKWFFQHPIHHALQLPFVVEILTEALIRFNGLLSTAEWEVSDKYLEYGYCSVIVVFNVRD
jgi:hypothetical protein